METTTFKYYGRRKLKPSKIKNCYITGGIELIAGLSGFITNGTESGTLILIFTILTAGGIFNIVYGLTGKSLFKELNYIIFGTDDIKYKNSFRKSNTLKINNLLDIRIEEDKAEFIFNNQDIVHYDFSVFTDNERKKIGSRLQEIKTGLV